MKNRSDTETISSTSGRERLVDAKGLLEALFDERSRPSVRRVRQTQSQRRIPYLKIGHLVRFDVDEVKRALEDKCKVHKVF